MRNTRRKMKECGKHKSDQLRCLSSSQLVLINLRACENINDRNTDMATIYILSMTSMPERFDWGAALAGLRGYCYSLTAAFLRSASARLITSALCLSLSCFSASSYSSLGALFGS